MLFDFYQHNIKKFHKKVELFDSVCYNWINTISAYRVKKAVHHLRKSQAQQ